MTTGRNVSTLAAVLIGLLLMGAGVGLIAFAVELAHLAGL